MVAHGTREFREERRLETKILGAAISGGIVTMYLLASEFQSLNQLMNASQMRQQVIAHNLANLNTPGYQRLEVQFEETLAKQLKSPGGAAGVTPQIVEGVGTATRADGNNVDVDHEVSQLHKNSMLFQTYSQLLSSQLDQMRRAIR